MTQQNGINELAATYQTGQGEHSELPALSDSLARQSPANSDPVEQLLANLDLWASTVTEKKAGGRGRGSKKGTELTGIKKLRELILELAVRGKLVKQNPSDEPASLLLQRIEAEKAQLLKDGKIKKPKKLPPVSDDEKPFELPDGWECYRLGNLITKLGSGSTPRGGKSAYVDSGIPFLRSQNVWNDGLDTSDIAYISKETHEKMDNTVVYPGDVLLNITGASLGRSTVFPSTYSEANVSQHVTIIRLVEPKMIRFIHLCIQAPLVQKLVWGRQVGMAIEGLSKKVLELFEMPIPPLAEQQRIVERVDQLMTLCDQLEQGCQQQLDSHQQLVNTLLAELTAKPVRAEPVEAPLRPFDSSTSSELRAQDDRADNPAWQRIHDQFDQLFSGAIQAELVEAPLRQAQGDRISNAQPILVGSGNSDWAIDRLKETILQLAVMGRLVEQDKDDEPASELLKRIVAEKARLVKDGKIKKPKKLPPVSDDEKPFKLPDGWEWVRISAISDVGTGATPARGNPEYYEPAEFNWVTSGETSNPFVSITKEKISAKAVAETNVTICPVGTLVIAMYGQGKTRGQITELLIPAGTNQACATIQLFEKCPAHRTYIKRFFEKAYDDIRSLAEGGAQPNLNIGKVSTTVIPIPPLAEQQRIVERVDQLFALCDQLKAKQQDANQTQQQLTEALVERALG